MGLVTRIRRHTSFTGESRSIRRSRVEAVVWFLLTLGLAVFIPDILVVMRPLGGLASMFMLTFPGKDYFHFTISLWLWSSVISGLCLLNLLLSNLIPISSSVLRLFLYILAGTYIATGCYILGSSVTYSIMSEANIFPKWFVFNIFKQNYC